MFWVSVKYVKGECLSLVLQKLNMGDHCEVFSPLEGSVLEILILNVTVLSLCSVSGSSNGVYYKHITINNMTVTSTFMHFNLQDDQPLFSTHKVMTSYTSTQVRFVNAYRNCTLADLTGILLHPPFF